MLLSTISSNYSGCKEQINPTSPPFFSHLCIFFPVESINFLYSFSLFLSLSSVFLRCLLPVEKFLSSSFWAAAPKGLMIYASTQRGNSFFSFVGLSLLKHKSWPEGSNPSLKFQILASSPSIKAQIPASSLQSQIQGSASRFKAQL